MGNLSLIGNTGSLDLSANELREMTDWSDALIEDYLSQSRTINQIVQNIDVNFGSMALQDANNVDITGGNIDNVTMDNVTIDGVVIDNADINTANVTTANVVTANITTANITTANIDDAEIIDLTVSGNTILGDASADTLTTNYGTLTVNNNIASYRALGAAAAGTTIVYQDEISFTGHSGGTTDIRGRLSKVTFSGSNAAANIELFDDQTEIQHTTGTLTTVNTHNGYVRLGLSGSTTGGINTLRVNNYHLANEGTGTISTAIVYNVGNVDLADGTGPINNMYGFLCQDIGHATRVANIAASFHGNNMTAGATATVTFNSAMNSGTGKWGFRHTGTANNAFNGATRFGSTTAPINTVDITGSFGRGSPVTKTGDFTLAATENWIINNKSGSTCVVTLPAASSWTGREVMIQNYQNQLVNSASSNVVPISGAAAGTAILPALAESWVTLVSNGTDWVQTEYFSPSSGSGLTQPQVMARTLGC